MTTVTAAKKKTKKWWWQQDFERWKSPPNSYAEKIWCHNCGEALWLFIRKGVLKKDVTVPCTKCGCDVTP